MIKTTVQNLEELRNGLALGILQLEIELEIFRPKLITAAIHPQMEMELRKQLTMKEHTLRNSQEMLAAVDKRIQSIIIK